MKLKKSWGAAVLCLATLMATAHARNLFVIPNTSGALQTIPVISGETFTTVGTISGSNIANVVKAHSTAAGDKIYLITSTASPAVIEVGGSSLQVVKLFSFLGGLCRLLSNCLLFSDLLAVLI